MKCFANSYHPLSSFLLTCSVNMSLCVLRCRCIKTNVRVVTLTAARWCVAGVWATGLLLALYPVLHWPQPSFYSSNGLCFPLHIDDPFTLGWQYSALVFLGINLAAVRIADAASLNTKLTPFSHESNVVAASSNISSSTQSIRALFCVTNYLTPLQTPECRLAAVVEVKPLHLSGGVPARTHQISLRFSFLDRSILCGSGPPAD